MSVNVKLFVKRLRLRGMVIGIKGTYQLHQGVLLHGISSSLV